MLLTAAVIPLTARNAWSLWEPAPLADAALAAAAACYLAGAARVRRRHPARPWPAVRAAVFLAGLAVIAVATQSAAAAYDDVLLSAHMVQHVLLLMVAPPLLVAGRPLTLLLHAARGPLHTRVKRFLRWPVLRALASPVAGTAWYAAAVAGTHAPPVMDLVVRHPAALAAEQVAYLAAGYLYFLPVVGSEPVPRRVPMLGRYLMLMAGMQVDTAVGIALLVQGREIYPAYARAGRGWGPSPLADLHHGGMIMWIGSDAVMTVLVLAVSAALVHDGRRAGRPGDGMEGQRRAGLARNLAAAGPSVPARRAAGPAADDDEHLAAYNAYLRALGDAAGPPPGRQSRPLAQGVDLGDQRRDEHRH